MCPVCGEPITQDTPVETHHSLPRHKGGTDELDNLVLIHTHCHKQVHSRSCQHSRLLSQEAL
ncbi:HNH endonuclease [Thermosynechococcus vestitus]|uniref:HNH endonuclease n=1 Tax=Thermosynechococcus vestitus TaxID=146786 RepID=UPI0038995A49